MKKKASILFVALVLVLAGLSIMTSAGAANFTVTLKVPEPPVSPSAGGNNDGAGNGDNKDQNNTTLKTAYDIDGDGKLEYLIDNNNNPADGYEKFIDPDGSSITISSGDIDGDGKSEFLIDTNKDGAPDKYWNPITGVISDIITSDINNDGIKEILIDTNNDGTYDHYYDQANNNTGTIDGGIKLDTDQKIKLVDIDNDGFLEKIILNSDGTHTFYESDPVGIKSNIVAEKDINGDGKNDFLIDINSDGLADVFWSPTTDVVSKLGIMDRDRNGTNEYYIDANNNGTFDFVFDPSNNSVMNIPQDTLYKDIDNDGRLEIMVNADGNISNGYEVFIDPDGSTNIIYSISASTNQPNYILDTNNDGIPDIYCSGTKNGILITTIKSGDLNNDNKVDYKLDTDGDGFFDKYFSGDSNVPEKDRIQKMQKVESMSLGITQEGKWIPNNQSSEIISPNTKPDTQLSEDEAKKYPIKLSLSVANNNIVADNNKAISVTVKATDNSGQIIKNINIGIKSNNQNSLISPKNSLTDKNGIASFFIKSRSAHTAKIEAYPINPSIFYISEVKEISFNGYDIQVGNSIYNKLLSAKVNQGAIATSRNVLIPMLAIAFLLMFLLSNISVTGHSIGGLNVIAKNSLSKRKPEDSYMAYYKKEVLKKESLETIKKILIHNSAIIIFSGIVLSLISFWIEPSIITGIILGAYLSTFILKYTLWDYTSSIPSIINEARSIK